LAFGPGKTRRLYVTQDRREHTECFAVDDSKTWPYLLLQSLERGMGKRVWLQNSGFFGHTSTDHSYVLRSKPVVKDAQLR
jgi:hypothetical protein